MLAASPLVSLPIAPDWLWEHAAAVSPPPVAATGIDIPGSGLNGSGDYGPTAGTGTITGRVFRDDNGNHRPDAGEPGLHGWTVFLDLDGTGVPGGTNVTTQSELDGVYHFTDLAADLYYPVRVELQDDAAMTVPLGNDFAETQSSAGTNPASIAADDFDGDGDPDLAVANYFSSNLSVFMNNGSGGFGSAVTYPIGPAGGSLPRSIVAADFTGDGRPDLAIADEYNDKVWVLRNNRGTFVAGSSCSLPVGSGPSCLTAGRFNADQYLDLAVTCFDTSKVSILGNSGTGTFSVQASYSVAANPTSVVSGDLDGDQDLDLAVACFGGDRICTLANAGNGSFAAAVAYLAGSSPSAVTTGDLDGDGDLDLAASNFDSTAGGVSLLWNSGSGSFSAPVPATTVEFFPCSVASADIDNDGDLDLIVVAAYGQLSGGDTREVYILRNRGDGSFDDASVKKLQFPDSYLFSVAPEDLNGDAVLDLAVANGDAGDSVSVFLNTVVPGAYGEKLQASETARNLDFGVQIPPTYVDNSGDWFIETDLAPVGLSPGDTVTFRKGQSDQKTGLIFGTSAFNSIQAAINAPRLAGTIRIGPGTFTECLTIGRSTTLLGAQAGVDASGGGSRAGGETVINASGAGHAITVTASYVTIDGFEICNAKMPTTDRRGVNFAPSLTNARIANNRILGADQGIVVGSHTQNVSIDKNFVSDCWIGMRASDYSGSEVAPTITGNRIRDCATGIYLAHVLGNSQVEVQGSQFQGLTAGATGWGLLSWEASFHASTNTFTTCGKAATGTWLHGGAIAGLNVNSGAGGPGLARSVIESNTFTCKDGSAIEGIYCDFVVRNNTITKQAGAAQKTLWAHMEGAPAQSLTTEWQIEANTITGPGPLTSEVGVYAVGLGSGTTRLLFAGSNTISSFGTGIEVATKAKAGLVGAAITGNGVGVRVNSGTALVQSCDLRDNAGTGLYVSNAAVVDAGQTGSGTNYTGLGVSTGNNNFSSYGGSGPLAIDNENPESKVGEGNYPPGARAQNNYWKTNVTIEDVVRHDHDANSLAWVDFSSPKWALRAADGVRPSGPSTVTISEAQALSVLDAARSRWYHLPGGSSLRNKLSQVRIVVTDLPDSCLGISEGTTIYLDRDAAGYGWFVDRTPTTSEEFRKRSWGADLRAVDPAGADKIDLWTVVAHELGHVAGLGDLARDQTLMNGALDAGIRRLPGRLEAQAVWAQYLLDLRESGKRR